MKLATLKDGTRDGSLIVVSRDLKHAIKADIGSGTVPNADPSAGPACIAEKRALEALAGGAAVTPFLKFGDRVRIEMFDAEGNSLFGAIEQRVARYTPPR